MKTIQKSLILVVFVFFVGIITAFPFVKTQVVNNNSNLTDTRTVIQVGGTKWAAIDPFTFDSGIWVWANLTNGGIVTEQEIPANADILSVDVPVRNVTAIESTGTDEVLTGVYQNLPSSFSKSRNPINLGSTYQHLIFLSSESLQQITADGIITKTEVSRVEKLGSAIVYSGNQEVNGTFAPAFMDNVLYNPADFNSRFETSNKYSFIDATNDKLIPTMYSFSTTEAAEEYANQKNEPIIGLDKLQEAEISLESVLEQRAWPCSTNYGLFFENKNFGGAWFAAQIGSYVRLEGTWWNKRISSVTASFNGQYTTLYEYFGFQAPFVRYKARCSGSSNLRPYFNDRASIVSVY